MPINKHLYTLESILQAAVTSEEYKRAEKQLEWEQRNGEEPRPYKTFQDVAMNLTDQLGKQQQWSAVYGQIHGRLISKYEYGHKSDTPYIPTTIRQLHSANIPAGTFYMDAAETIVKLYEARQETPNVTYSMDDERRLFIAAAGQAISDMSVDDLRRIVAVELGERMHYFFHSMDCTNPVVGEELGYFEDPSDENY